MNLKITLLFAFLCSVNSIFSFTFNIEGLNFIINSRDDIRHVSISENDVKYNFGDYEATHVSTKSYFLNSRGVNWFYSYVDSDGRTLEGFQGDYNDLGVLTKKEYFYTKNTGDVYVKYVDKFNYRDEYDKSILYELKKTDGSNNFLLKVRYIYNQYDKVVQEEIYDNNSNLIKYIKYSYDGAMNKVREIHLDRYDNVQKVINLKYSEDGLLLEKITYDNKENIVDSLFFKYNAQNKIIEKINYSNSKKIINRYTYLPDGKLYQKSVLNEYGDVLEVIEVEYSSSSNRVNTVNKYNVDRGKLFLDKKYIITYNQVYN